MIFPISWLAVVAAAVSINIWHYSVAGRIAYESIPSQLTIVILEGIISFWLG